MPRLRQKREANVAPEEQPGQATARLQPEGTRRSFGGIGADPCSTAAIARPASAVCSRGGADSTRAEVTARLRGRPTSKQNRFRPDERTGLGSRSHLGGSAPAAGSNAGDGQVLQVLRGATFQQRVVVRSPHRLTRPGGPRARLGGVAGVHDLGRARAARRGVTSRSATPWPLARPWSATGSGSTTSDRGHPAG